MKLKLIQVGKGSILVDNEQFINGYQAGHIACTIDRRKYAMTSDNIIGILKEKMEDAQEHEQYSIGYCVGWISTLVLKGPCDSKGSGGSCHHPEGRGR